MIKISFYPIACRLRHNIRKIILALIRMYKYKTGPRAQANSFRKRMCLSSLLLERLPLSLCADKAFAGSKPLGAFWLRVLGI